MIHAATMPRALLQCLATCLPISVMLSQSTRPTLHLTELRRISGREQDLSKVGLVTFGGDGTIWITQPRDGYIAGFSATGARLGNLGRHGEGPGDFRYSPKLIWVADSGVWIFDASLQRVTKYVTKPRSVRTFPVRLADKLPPEAQLSTAGSQHAYYTKFSSSEAQAVDQDNSYTLAFYSAPLNGGKATYVATSTFPQCTPANSPRPGFLFATDIPLCHEGFHPTTPDADFLGVVLPLDDSDDQSGFDLALFSANGEVVSRSRHLLNPSPIPDSVRDSKLDVLRSMAADPQIRAPVQEVLDLDLIPYNYAPVVAVTITKQGQVWATVHSGPTDRLQVLGIRPDGTEIGIVPLPPHSEVGWVGNGRMLLIEEQESGFQDVVLYSVEGSH